MTRTAAARQDAARQDVAHQDVARQDAARQDVARQDVARQDVARHDAWQVAATRERERGSGTLWVVVAVAVLTTFAVGAATVGAAIVTRHRASSAADFAALAGADAVAQGAAAPCAAAMRVAARYGADLTSCTTTGMVVDVVVEMPAGGLLGAGWTATVRARAGPP